MSSSHGGVPHRVQLRPIFGEVTLSSSLCIIVVILRILELVVNSALVIWLSVTWAGRTHLPVIGVVLQRSDPADEAVGHLAAPVRAADQVARLSQLVHVLAAGALLPVLAFLEVAHGLDRGVWIFGRGGLAGVFGSG